MKTTLIPDTEAFLAGLEKDILGAKKRVLIQTMSFEGDMAGEWLFDRLTRSKAPDRRFCIDSYSRINISDSWVHSPATLFKPMYRQEIRETKRLIRSFPDHGVHVRFTNPLGPLLWRFPMRNHKKLVVIDDTICYTGGYNFSEHNFRWRDMAFRFEDREANRFFTDDFDSSWNGINRSAILDRKDSAMIVTNGIKSADAFDFILGFFAQAKKKITVFSPYFTDPFMQRIVAAKKPGVELVVISPETNNKPICKDFLLAMQREYGYTIQFYKGNMSHLKAALIDDSVLVTGTSNLDFVSYYIQPEIFTVFKQGPVVKEFVRLIHNRDMESSTQHTAGEPDRRVMRSKRKMDIGMAYCRFLSRFM